MTLPNAVEKVTSSPATKVTIAAAPAAQRANIATTTRTPTVADETWTTLPLFIKPSLCVQGTHGISIADNTGLADLVMDSKTKLLISSALLRVADVLASTELSAAKVDDLVAKYPGIAESIRRMEEADPSPTKKYLPWMVKQMVQRYGAKANSLLQGSDFTDMLKAVQTFHKNVSRLEKKDITQYSLNALLDEVKRLESTVSKRAEKKLEKKEATYLMMGDRWLLIHPKTMKASCHYGAGTKWCISATEKNMFDSYSAGNHFFYFLIDREANERDPWSKVAIVLTKHDPKQIEFYDQKDSDKSESEVSQAVGHDVLSEALRLARADIQTRPEHPVAALRYSKDPAVLLDLFERWQSNDPSLQGPFFSNKPSIAGMFLKNSSTPTKVINDLYDDFMNEVPVEMFASHQNTGKDLLEHLAKSRRSQSLVVRALALNPNTPESVLRGFYKEMKKEPNGFENFVQSLPKNPRLPDDIREALVNSVADTPGMRHVWLMDSLLENKSLTREELEKLADYVKLKDHAYLFFKHTNASVNAIKKVINSLPPHLEPTSLMSMLREGEAPLEWYRGLVDSVWAVRYAIANSSNTPVEALLELVGDEDDLISKKAAANIKEREATYPQQETYESPI